MYLLFYRRSYFPNSFSYRGSGGVVQRALERFRDPSALPGSRIPPVFTVKMKPTLNNPY